MTFAIGWAVSETSDLSEERPEQFNRRLAAVLAGFGPLLADKQNLPFGRKMLRTGLSLRRRSGRRRLQPEIST
jgi:hypothetical protein